MLKSKSEFDLYKRSFCKEIFNFLSSPFLINSLSRRMSRRSQRRSSVTTSCTAFPINLYDILGWVGRDVENGDGATPRRGVLFETLRCAENGDNLIFWEGPPYRTCIRGQWCVLDGYGSRDQGRARAFSHMYTSARVCSVVSLCARAL